VNKNKQIFIPNISGELLLKIFTARLEKMYLNDVTVILENIYGIREYSAIWSNRKNFNLSECKMGFWASEEFIKELAEVKNDRLYG